MLFGVDNCEGRWDALFGRVVVVADNEIQAEGLGVKRFIVRADAAIHGDDQLYAVRFEIIQRVVIKAVAFVESIRDVALYFAIHCFKRLHEKRGGCDSVHIVVAVDGNRFMMFESMDDAVNCGAHACHLKRIGVEVRLGFQVGKCFGLGRITAIEENLFKQRGSGNGRQGLFG